MIPDCDVGYFVLNLFPAGIVGLSVQLFAKFRPQVVEIMPASS